MRYLLLMLACLLVTANCNRENNSAGTDFTNINTEKTNFIALQQNSKEYEFVSKFIDALHMVSWGFSKDAEIQLFGANLKKDFDPEVVRTKIMSIYLEGIKKYEEATTLLLKSTANDLYMEVVRKSFKLGTLGLITVNTKRLNQFKDLKENKAQAFEDAEIITLEKEAWLSICTASGFILPIVMEGAKSENPTGPIPYKISREERKQLIKKMYDLLGNDIDKYEKQYY